MIICKKTKFKIFCILLVFFLAGCASLNSKKEFNISPNLLTLKNSTLAVLPFDNASNDLTAEKFLREKVLKKFISKGWTVISNESVDEKLNELGISDGGQLAAFNYQELGSKVGARILCYGYIEDFKFQNLGYVVIKNVSLSLRLVDSITGETLFEGRGIGKDTQIHTSKEEAKKAFILENAFKLAGNILNKPLAQESEKAIDEIFKNLP